MPERSRAPRAPASRSCGIDCQTRSVSPSRSRDALEDPGRAEPAVLVVDRDHAAARRDAQALARRLDPLVLGHRREAGAELPGRLLAQNPRRLAVRVALDDAAVDLELAVREGERRRVEPERVVVLRPERGRGRPGHLVERFLRRLPPTSADRQPVPRIQLPPLRVRARRARAPPRATSRLRAARRAARATRSGSGRASR